MIRWRALLIRLSAPGLPWMLALLLCVPALFLLFAAGLEQSPLAYPLYAVSTYALAVWVVGGIGAARRVRATVYAHPLVRRYRTDLPFRGRLSLCSSTAVNLGYGVFELGCALVSRSVWFGALGCYYLLLAAARGVLLWRAGQKGTTLRQQLLAARLCGWLLLALTLVLSAMAAQMVVDGKGYRYPGSMIFVMAFYAFYSVTLSLINFVRFRRLNSPVLSASKVLGVATALVSMLSLQTAMFAAFGGDYAYRRLMNALTGGGVCLLVLSMAIFLLVRVQRALSLEKRRSIHGR